MCNYDDAGVLCAEVIPSEEMTSKKRRDKIIGIFFPQNERERKKGGMCKKSKRKHKQHQGSESEE